MDSLFHEKVATVALGRLDPLSSVCPIAMKTSQVIKKILKLLKVMRSVLLAGYILRRSKLESSVMMLDHVLIFR